MLMRVIGPSRKNASRLRTKEDIAARVMELQGVAARSTEITIDRSAVSLMKLMRWLRNAAKRQQWFPPARCVRSLRD